MTKQLVSCVGLLFALLGSSGPSTVVAAPNDVIAISCPSAVHVSQFSGCVHAYVISHGSTGLFVASSTTAPLSALVRSSGTWFQTCGGFCIWTGGTLTAIQMDGTPLTSDAQLTTIDQSMFAQLRTASALTAVILVPTDYGGSYINNSALDEDTNSAISFVLYITRSINPNSVPIGTIVVVKWNDGTTAKFVRVSQSGSFQWAYMPGSARNAQGQPINPDGSIVANPHSTGTGAGSVDPNVTGSGGYIWNLRFNGDHNCTGTSTLTDETGTVIARWLSYFPC